jgi:hypothetical protein
MTGSAIKWGHLSSVMFLEELGVTFIDDKFLFQAIKDGHLTIVNLFT